MFIFHQEVHITYMNNMLFQILSRHQNASIYMLAYHLIPMLELLTLKSNNVLLKTILVSL